MAKGNSSAITLGFAATILAVLLSVLAGPRLAVADQPARVWQIGRTDNASLEFNKDWDFSQGSDPTFTVGKSNEQRDWSAFHPGTRNTQQGHRAHPFTVLFQLERAPHGMFVLTVDALFTRPRVPQYIVDINGHRGRFYFHPTLGYDSSYSIAFSTDRLRISLPASYLHLGQNRLVLTCVDDSSDVLLPATDEESSTSGLYYDALALENDVNAVSEQPLTARVIPTIFYKSREPSSLREVVVIEAQAPKRLGAITANLMVADVGYPCVAASDYEFGEAECAVEVPELGKTTRASLAITTDGRTVRFPASIEPQKKFKLFLVPQTHFDPGYTDYRPNSYEVHARSLDRIIEELESHPQYRFTPDGSWLFADYWAHRDTKWRERATALIKAQRIDVPAQLFNLATGLASQEELNRLGYFSQEFATSNGLALDTANLCDVPAATWSLPSYLHSIDVKYLAVASDQYRAPIIIHGRLNEKSPFWWEGPDGGRVLTWYSHHYHQIATLFEAPPALASGVDGLPIYLQTYGSSYIPDAVMLYGTQSDNQPFDPRMIEIVDSWNKEFAYPRITVANIRDFFEYLERRYGQSFQTIRGDGGAWWEEMAFANAIGSGVDRRAKSRAVSAETLASLGVIANADFRFPYELDHELWSNLLQYSEHVWGHSNEWSHPESELGRSLQKAKESFAFIAATQADELLRRGFDQLHSRIDARNDLVVVFNPLSWTRAGLVEVELPRNRGLMDLVTQKPVDTELLRREEGEDYDRVRFWAEDVPAVGYRSYAITGPSRSRPAQETSAAETNVIENSYYRITVAPDRAGITSIFDKILKRELVDQTSRYAVNQYVYVGYGHEDAGLIQDHTTLNSSLLQYNPALPPPTLTVDVAGAGRVTAVSRVPWGTLLRLESSAVHTPRIVTEIRLFDHEKRIELINTVNKQAVHAPEGVYFAFPFASQRPTIRYDIQSAWVDPTHDQLPGANKEWFAAQHWVAITDSKATIALQLEEAPLFTLGDVVRGKWPTRLEIPSGTIFSYVMNNYDGDDDRAYQGGEFTFHYVIGSDGQFTPATLTRIGMESNASLEVDASPLNVTRTDTPQEPLNAAQASFLKLDNSDVVLSTLKAAENGRGFIFRFYNASDREVASQIEFPGLQLEAVNRTSPVEVDREAISASDGRFSISLRPHEIYSLRITGMRLKAAANGQLP